jgi:C4-dicarboxylate transporter
MNNKFNPFVLHLIIHFPYSVFVLSAAILFLLHGGRFPDFRKPNPLDDIDGFTTAFIIVSFYTISIFLFSISVPKYFLTNMILFAILFIPYSLFIYFLIHFGMKQTFTVLDSFWTGLGNSGRADVQDFFNCCGFY